MPTFDGENLIITLDSEVTIVNVEQDLYSDWKEWFKQGGNSKYPLAFRTTGGDAVTATSEQGAYFFLQNQLGWRIRPPEENTTIYFEGNLVAEDITLPIVTPTLGGFTVLLLGIQPITEASILEIEDVRSDLATVKSMQFSDQELVGNQVIHVDADSQSELARFNTYDKYGNPTTDPGRIVKKSKV